jgi:hypothetical protein
MISTLIALVSCFTILPFATAVSDLSLVQPSEDRFILENDTIALRWADYISGNGKQLFTLSPATGLNPDNRTVVEIGNRSVETSPGEQLECKQAVDLDRYVLSLCSKNFVTRTSIADYEETAEKISVGSNLECFSILTATPLKDTAVILCQYSGADANSSLVLAGVQSNPLKILYTWEIPQSESKIIRSTQQLPRITMVHGHKLYSMVQDVFVIYNIDDQQIRFRALSIKGQTPDQFTNLGWFDGSSRIATQLDLAKDCSMLTVQVGFPYMRLAVWCKSKNSNMYLRCDVSKLSLDSVLECPSEFTLEEPNQSKPQTLSIVQDKSSERSYAMKLDGVVALDFTEKTIRRVFNLTDGFGDDPAVSYKSTAVFGNFGYVLQLQRDGAVPATKLQANLRQSADSWSLWCYIFNFERNYYVGDKILSDIPRTEIDQHNTAAVFEEELFGGNEPYIFVISSRYKKLLLFETKSHSLVLNGSKNAQKVNPDDFFNTSRVSITASSGNSKRAIVFDAKIISDVFSVNIFDPPKEWMVYKGKSSYNLPVANEAFMGYASSLDAAQGSLKPNVEYLNKVDIEIPELADIRALKSDQGGELLLISDTEYTAVACIAVVSAPPTTTQARVKCTNLFRKENRDGQFIVSFIIAGDFTYVLSQEKGQMTLELINNKDGSILSAVTLPYTNRLAQIREFNSYVIFETIGYGEDDSLLLNYGYANLGQNIDPTNIKSFSEFYQDSMTPISLQKGSRKTNSIFIETSSQERFKILEFGYNLQMIPTENKEVDLSRSISLAKTCYFTKYTFVADLTNQKIFTITRGTNPATIKEYPFTHLGLEKVEELHCDYDNAQVVAKIKDPQDKTVLVIYRVEDGPLEALRRIHSIIKTDSTSSLLLAVLGSIQDTESATVLTYNIQDSKFEAYNYQLYAPKISFSLPAQEDSRYSLEITHSVEQSETKKSQVDILPIDQDRKITLDIYSKAPIDATGSIQLDQYLSVDGLGVTAELVNIAQNINGKVSVNPRVSASVVVDTPKFSTTFKKMIFSERLVVAWKDDRIGIAEAGQEDSPFEMATKSLRECQIIEDSEVVSCYARTSDLEASKVYLIHKLGKDSKWVSVESSVNFMIRKVKTFMLQSGVYLYAMMDINNEIINVGAFVEEKFMLIGKGQFINYVQNKKMNTFDVLTIQNRLLVVKNDLGSKFVTFMEFGFDSRLNRISLMRTHNIAIFDTANPGFSKPIQLKCHKIENNTVADVFCFGAQDDVHSFVAQMRFPIEQDSINQEGIANTTSVSRIFARKVFNVQGFSIERVKVVQNWALVTAIRNEKYTKTVEGIKSKVIILVYKVDKIYSHPFALIQLEDFKLSASDLHKLELSAKLNKENKNKLVLTAFSSEPQDIYTVKKYNISSFELIVAPDFKSQAKGQTMLQFTSPFTSEPVKKLLTDVVFVEANSGDSKWFTSAKFFITLAVIVVVFIFLIGCFHAFKRIQKLNQSGATEGSKPSNSFLAGGDTSNTMGDEDYMKVQDEGRDNRL